MIITRDNMPDLLYDILDEMGGQGTLLEVCKNFWNKHEADLRVSGDLFYTWQYDIRWAATALRKDSRMIDADLSPRGVWEIC